MDESVLVGIPVVLGRFDVSNSALRFSASFAREVVVECDECSR